MPVADYIYCENCEQLTRVDEIPGDVIYMPDCKICGAEGKDLIYYSSQLYWLGDLLMLINFIIKGADANVCS